MNSTDLPLDSLDNGFGAKIIAMAALGLGSFLSGILPAAVSDRNRRRFPLSISLMLCFGAGILLATALVHMLPDVRKVMPNNAEVYFCGGFFIVYFIDEFIHYFFGEAIQHSHSETTPETGHQHNHHQHSHNLNNYGSNGQSEPLLRPNGSSHHADLQQNCETVVRQANERICHTSHREPCSQSMTGTLGLLVALSLHSFVEGLAIGVQISSTEVLFLFAAVACHKFVMGFCLGLEFRSNPGATFRSQLLAISTFSLGSVLGIGVGMAIVVVPSDLSRTALPIIQALAGGTLLYVTVCEVMPREKANWHQKPDKRFAGLAQFLAVTVGFSIMTLINYFIGGD